jgi:hypothetical protein
MALPAGFSPASFRLEDGCLVYSTTAAIQNWSARQDLHLRSLGPKPSALAATLRAENSGRLILETSERRNTPPKTLAIGSAVRFEIGGSEGTCTLSLPADNGLLL